MSAGGVVERAVLFGDSRDVVTRLFIVCYSGTVVHGLFRLVVIGFGFVFVFVTITATAAAQSKQPSHHFCAYM